jgi:hypothetical protein
MLPTVVLSNANGNLRYRTLQSFLYFSGYRTVGPKGFEGELKYFFKLYLLPCYVLLSFLSDLCVFPDKLVA